MKFFVFPLILALAMPASARELLIYGGAGHDDFLGCLTCGEFDPDSVCNRFGSYGNKFSSSGIWNRFSGYGNEFSSSSPWNRFASGNSIPILVDRDGGFHGYFTTNEYRSRAVRFASDMKRWYEEADGDLEKVRLKLCQAFRYGG
ncbi:MAG: hypothetical protein GDA39_02930 [Hyphomonadaceae bacterium]|nr:hypothetical protein [Hyphomonadaceae bacterium]MBC6411914.1 hypothetical protein [Hyphomonadaceae bacterium]